MTEDDKRAVTEWLGEKSCSVIGLCIDCTHPDCEVCPEGSNRTFTEPQDFFACFNRLVELKQWTDFCEWSAFEENYGAENLGGEYDEWSKWLLSKTPTGEYRLCQLVADWLKGES